MDKLAFIFGNTYIYWNSILVMLAVAAGLCCFAAVYLASGGKPLAAAVFAPVSLVLGLVFSRAIHWYCLPNQYLGLRHALTTFTGGGYALTGCFLGCLAAAAVLRLCKLEMDLPRFLDCLSIAGCLAIALGRLSFFYSPTDKGMIVAATRLPLAFQMTNSISGALEYRFATFLFQAMLLGLLFLGLLAIFLRDLRLPRLPKGDITLVFLLCYSAIGVVMDSTRYDALYLRSNGFVSIVQILCALTLIGVILFYSLHIRKTGIQQWYITLWVLAGLLIGGAGFMEYYVQRHGKLALFSYSVMSACLAEVVVITLILRTQYLRLRQLHSTPAYSVSHE